MLTVRAGSQMLCSSLAIVVAGVGWPLARANVFDYFCPIGMKGTPIMPAWEVQAVSHAAYKMEPLRTPTLVCTSVSVLVGAESVDDGEAVDAATRENCLFFWGLVGSGSAP